MKINKNSKISKLITDDKFNRDLTTKIEKNKNLYSLEKKFSLLCQKSFIKRYRIE